MLTRRYFSVLFILNVCVAVCLARKRIYGGAEAKIADYPWHVSLLDNKNNKQYCAGSILSQSYVLTAAHCLYGKTSSSLSIKYGTNRLDDNTGFTLPVVKLASHPYFKEPLDHDVGIVTVGAPYIKFSSNAQPATLRAVPARTGESLVVTGHGKTTARGNPISPILQATTLYTMDWNKCAKIPGMHGVLTKAMICAARNDRSTCPGDSGGAVFAKFRYVNTQVALVSGAPPINGQKACHPGHPSIFTNVANYENWINEETQHTTYWSLD